MLPKVWESYPESAKWFLESFKRDVEQADRRLSTEVREHYELQ
jgi:hypothetical protein